MLIPHPAGPHRLRARPRFRRTLHSSSYVQNIRNNANKKRTPKWARKAGFIDETEENRRKAKNQWSGRCVLGLPAPLSPLPSCAAQSADGC
jgi:hypothetical protein